jgi:uncharacterized protein YjbI with pentapeptide repeats
VADPATLTSLAGLVLALGKAWRDDDFGLDAEGWALLKDFVSTAPKLVQMFGGEPDPELAAEITKLGIEAFREALRRHWAGSSLMVPRRVRFWQRWSREYGRDAEIRACIATALDGLAQPAPAMTRSLPELCVDQPELLPLYLELFSAFEQHGHDVDPPLLDRAPGVRPAFDRQFRAAWKQLLTQQQRVALRRWLDAIAGERRRESVRELLLADHVAWSSGHVFAAADDVPELPPMPPEDFYVEPGAEGCKEKLLAEIEAALASKRVVFVTADFGYGKSLTARTLASRWARAHLEQAGAGERAPMPIYVPCGELDWAGEAMPVDEMIRAAWMRQFERISDEKLADDDDGLTPPGGRERAWVIIDGLDEAQLGAAALAKFLKTLRAASSNQRRFVLFFRPSLLSALSLEQGDPHLRISPFGDAEIAEWLHLWNWGYDGPPLSADELTTVRELASVPILLFMIAYQWRQGQGAAIEDRHSLYEGFATTLARGKFEGTGKRPERLRATASAMARQLKQRLALLRPRTRSTAIDDQVAALLWLMGRIAWLGYKTHKGPDLGISELDIDRVLEELGIERTVVDFHRISLLTCMQGRLEGEIGQRYLFFGHRSFHEFFVAQFWRDTLVEIASGKADELALVGQLLEGELMPERLRDDQALKFLLGFLDRLEPEQRSMIERWAHRIARGHAPTEALAQHRNWQVLRVAALAVDCHLGSNPELTPAEFRSMFVKMWATNEWRPVHAPGLQVPEADLSYMVLAGSNFERCNFRGAELNATNLDNVNLFGTDLTQSKILSLGSRYIVHRFEHLRLPGFTAISFAQIDGAILTDSRLRSTCGLAIGQMAPVLADSIKISDVTIIKSAHGSFQRSAIYGASFVSVHSSGDWTEAQFENCVFIDCDFSKAIFHQTKFFSCRYESCIWPTMPMPYGLTAGTDLLAGRM